MRKILLPLALLLIFFVSTTNAEAQCAMCKAVAESSVNADGDQMNTAAGINKGIIYIMFVPYILLGFLFWYFFRGKIKGFFQDMGIIAGSPQ